MDGNKKPIFCIENLGRTLTSSSWLKREQQQRQQAAAQMVDSEICPVCDGTGLLLETSCPLCEDVEASHIQDCAFGRSAYHQSCISPVALEAEDLAETIARAMKKGKSSFKRLRRYLNGDPSLTYSVDESGNTVSISSHV